MRFELESNQCHATGFDVEDDTDSTVKSRIGHDLRVLVHGNGIYDIIMKITSDNLDDIKETITKHIRTIKTIRSTMTLIVAEDK